MIITGVVTKLKASGYSYFSELYQNYNHSQIASNVNVAQKYLVSSCYIEICMP